MQHLKNVYVGGSATRVIQVTCSPHNVSMNYGEIFEFTLSGVTGTHLVISPSFPSSNPIWFYVQRDQHLHTDNDSNPNIDRSPSLHLFFPSLVDTIRFFRRPSELATGRLNGELDFYEWIFYNEVKFVTFNYHGKSASVHESDFGFLFIMLD